MEQERNRAVDLQQVVRCLAHCIYWPLFIAGWTLSILSLFAFVVFICVLVWVGVSSLWKNSHEAALVVATVAVAALVIGGYEWSKRKLGKDT